MARVRGYIRIEFDAEDRGEIWQHIDQIEQTATEVDPESSVRMLSIVKDVSSMPLEIG